MFDSQGGSTAVPAVGQSAGLPLTVRFDPRGRDLALPTNLEPNPPESRRLGFRSRKVVSSIKECRGLKRPI